MWFSKGHGYVLFQLDQEERERDRFHLPWYNGRSKIAIWRGNSVICTLTEGSNCTEDQAEGQKTQFFHVLSSKAAVCFTLHQHRLIFFIF